MSEADTSDALDEQIEVAQQAGNVAEANRLYQLQIGSTGLEHLPVPAASGAEGDDVAADPSDSAGLAGTTTPPPLNTELVDQVLGVYGDEDADEVAELRQEWPGTEMAAELGYVKWFLEEYVPPHLIERVPDDIDLLRLGAAVGRELFHRHHLDAGERSEGARNMSEIDADNFDERADALVAEEEQARAAGNLGKANRLEREIRALFVRRFGTGPAVGSSGGPTS